MGFMNRRNPDGRRSHAQMIVDWHDMEVGVGETYGYDELMAGTCLTKNQIKKARELDNNPTLNRLFVSERQPGKIATYLKTENWYWQGDDEA